LDEWIYFLKNEEIKEDFQAKGLLEAREKLDIMKLTPSEKVAYDRHLKALRREASLYQSSYVLGEQKGEQKKANEGALNLIRMNALSDEQIAQAMGLSTEEVAQLRQTITDEGS
jgi:predicted transposase YdaD